MTAKEMFKELGFKRKKYSGYIDYKDILTWNETIVSFDIKNKLFEVYCEHYVENYKINESVDVNIALYKAITKQFEELGWLND